MARTRSDVVAAVGCGVAGVMAVVALRLPWASNSIVGDEGAGDVLGEDGVMLAALVLLVAAPLAVVGLLVGTRRSLLGAIAACGAALLGLAVCAMEVRSQSANSIGENIATGQIVEDWADSRPGSGMWLFALAVVVVLGLAGLRLVETLRARTPA